MPDSADAVSLSTHCHPSARRNYAAMFIGLVCATGDLLFSDCKQQIPRAANLSMGTLHTRGGARNDSAKRDGLESTMPKIAT